MARKREIQAPRDPHRFYPQHRTSINALPQSGRKPDEGRALTPLAPARYFAVVHSFSPLRMGTDADFAYGEIEDAHRSTAA